MRRCGWLMYLVMLTLFSNGCGARQATVGLEGEVTYNGRAVEKGRIEFIPSDGTTGPSAGTTVTGGRYELPAKWGLLPNGIYLAARITGFKKAGRTEPNRVERGGPPVEVEENFIPAAYNSQSTLKVRISELADKNKADFHLPTTPAAH